ncbi:helicase-related protein [Rhizobium sp. SIMBA_035]
MADFEKDEGERGTTSRIRCSCNGPATARFSLRVTEYEATDPPPLSSADEKSPSAKAPAAFIATRLAALLQSSRVSICYVALSEFSAERVARSIRCLFPDLDVIELPPWDCLPYDRVPPSRSCMGRRMDALRVWSEPSRAPRLLITSLNAVLQRIPPLKVIRNSRFAVRTGRAIDRHTFEAFVRATGYAIESVVNEPGEIAIRDEVIDIFPAGAATPMRIVLGEDDEVVELRSYDPATQRTTELQDETVFGPASEAIPADDGIKEERPSRSMELTLLQLYDTMPTVFGVLGQCCVAFAFGAEARIREYLDIVDDARQADDSFRAHNGSHPRSLYLDRAEWDAQIATLATVELDVTGGDALPPAGEAGSPRRFREDVALGYLWQGRTVVMAGRGRSLNALCQRVEKTSRRVSDKATAWDAVLKTRAGSLIRLESDVEEGFVDEDQNLVLIPASKDRAPSLSTGSALIEPEIEIGDVVVHEDHGISILSDLDRVAIEGSERDAARLQFRDGASLLVPTEEFGKIWRYGSHPGSVTLERLHTDGWRKTQARIVKDIRSTARHLIKLARERQAAKAERFVAPRREYGRFVRRFPYSETRDQLAAIKAVLSDLSSGRAMNRLICGDVGFGKTEIALRAAAAVAFAGGQVVVIAPTTVLARQHFSTFQRRFVDTGITVAMLSRLVKPSGATGVKAGLVSGEISIVVATQAILAKDVAFSRLGLLIVDEEHRFGLNEKRAMSALAPTLHTLAMSATPIPRTLQSAMIGIQDVNLLVTPPSKRRPVRTSLGQFDKASMRTALMREFRRGGQSFVVVPRIEDIGVVEAILAKIVPELAIRIAHGKMSAEDIDEAIVGFASGDGDILLATNIIENGLDVPRANTMFIWRADRFGLAQLHQLRGRVGRARVQGFAYLLTEEGAVVPEETRLRLSTLVENDRLGSGLSISMRDLDLRGGGDVAGEEQSGHIKAIGIGLYQRLLEQALTGLHGRKSSDHRRPIVNLGVSGSIPRDYVSDPAVRFNFHVRLLHAASIEQVDDLEEEFEDRFGDPPEDVSILLRLTRLQIAAARFALARLEAGPKALAVTVTPKTPAKVVTTLLKSAGSSRRGDRVVFERATQTGAERASFFEKLLSVH